MKLKDIKNITEETKKRLIVISIPKAEARSKFSYYVETMNIEDYASCNVTGIMLTSLEGSPKQFVDFYCNMNHITSLVGGPEIITETMNCQRNKLTDLIGAPRSCKDFYATVNNPISHLRGVGKDYLQECENIYITTEKITSHVLGLLRVKNLDFIYAFTIANKDDNPKWLAIIDVHLRNGKDIMDCQEELIQAGLKEYAKL